LKKAGVTVPAAGSDLNKDDISPSHLRWLVDSRTANQKAALKLYTLLCDHSEQMVTPEWSAKAQHLVAACFSLWRAAFLADKGVKRSEVQAHARTFLAKMLVDNAITYPQDRSTRNWTFNYYMNNATNELVILSKDWPDIAAVLKKKARAVAVINGKIKKIKLKTAPQRRWNKTQRAFETAVECLEKALQP